jgi:hypothetical protein
MRADVEMMWFGRPSFPLVGGFVRRIPAQQEKGMAVKQDARFYGSSVCLNSGLKND